MATIMLRNFGGMAPSANAQAIGEEQATYAQNLNLRFADFRPLAANASVIAATAGQSLYRFESNGTFITRTVPVNFVRGPIPNDATERTYYTGDGAPKVVDNTGTVRQLGVPQPGAAPTVSITSGAVIYSEEDARSERVTKFGQVFDKVRANLTKPSYGITNTELGQAPFTGKFTAGGSGDLDAAYFIIAGANSAGGNFTATNASHNNLNDWRAGFEVGVGVAYANIKVRAEGMALAAGLSAALRTVTGPNGATTPLMSVETADGFVKVVTENLALADKNRDECIVRMKANLNEFVKLADSGDPGSSAARGEIEAFYARSDISGIVGAAITTAVSEIISAMKNYTGGNGTSIPITGKPGSPGYFLNP